ncbi:MAG: hypothetical protein JW811_01635 [Clostridiales bacterium]|nr:hypothetical protein [Clostridiales bacterium]
MLREFIRTDASFLKTHTTQPKWWKISKIFVLLGALIAVGFIFNVWKAAVWLGVIVVLTTAMHFMYRIKTHVYTKTWMDFKVWEVDGKLIYGRIGFMYYPLVAAIFVIATAIILLI